MWFVLLSTLVVGAASAWLRVLVLLPVTLVFLTIVVRVGFLSGFTWSMIALTVAAGAALLQLSYIAGAFLLATARQHRVRELPLPV